MKVCVFHVCAVFTLSCNLCMGSEELYKLNRNSNPLLSDQQTSQVIRESQMPEVPSHLYIILSPAEWQESQSEGKLILSPHHDPFIHLAKEDQLLHVTQKFWKDSDYFILTIDPEKMIGQLVYEVNPGGSTKYYHLYEGLIPLDAVTDTTFVHASLD